MNVEFCIKIYQENSVFFTNVVNYGNYSNVRT